MIHAHKFNDCYQDMVRLMDPSSYPTFGAQQEGMAKVARILAKGIFLGQRFYYPTSDGILDNKEISDDIKELVRLPSECICILTEQNFHDAKGEFCNRITVAFSEEFNAANHIVKPVWDVDFYAFSVLDVSNFYPDNRWIPSYFGASCKFAPQGVSGYEITGIMTSAFKDSPLDPAQEMRPDIADVLNLTVMLNLSNVSAREEVIPERLNRKRLKCNRMPLFSYHVLEVDGERWSNRIGSSGGDKTGVRSHMRRGHIRRLSPEKKIWVRSTLVHGSRPGFVAKEYHVGGL